MWAYKSHIFTHPVIFSGALKQNDSTDAGRCEFRGMLSLDDRDESFHPSGGAGVFQAPPPQIV